MPTALPTPDSRLPTPDPQADDALLRAAQPVVVPGRAIRLLMTTLGALRFRRISGERVSPAWADELFREVELAKVQAAQLAECAFNAAGLEVPAEILAAARSYLPHIPLPSSPLPLPVGEGQGEGLHQVSTPDSRLPIPDSPLPTAHSPSTSSLSSRPGAPDGAGADTNRPALGDTVEPRADATAA